MSLQVWLPLIKDLRNQGLSDVTVTGTSVFKNIGKLGAKSLDLNTRISFNCPTLANKKIFSITFWAKVNEDSTLSTNWVDVIGFTDAKEDGTLGQLRWETCYDSGYTTRGISSHDNATHAIGPFGYIIGATKGNWYHIACIVDIANNEIKEYCNGELIATREPNGGHLTGAFWLGETGKVNGEIQDVRIYDHALSQMEVKELSKGLVLHYPLNRQGWGQENLLLNTNDLTKWSKESTCTVTLENDGYYHIVSTNTNGSRYGIYYDLTFPEVGTYTLSADVRTDWRIGFAASSSFGWTSNTVTGIGNAQHIIKTITTTSENNKCRIYINSQMNSSGVVTNSTYIKNIKVEKGSITTPWCPNSADTLATSMGLNGTTEYDCSGFENNGIKNNIPTYSSDTAKYQVSTHLDGINQTIQLPNVLTLIPDSIFTFNIWFKRLSSEPSSKPWETLFGGPSGFEIETCSANNVHDNKIKAYSWGGGTIEFELDKWNMLTMVSNGTNTLFYLNGELKLTSTYKTLVSGNYFIGSWRDTATQNYKGYVSDARIYATALSADDVKSLYQNSAYIDSNGNVYGAVHSEV